MFCRSLFVLSYFFLLAIVLSVLLRYTDSDYSFGIKLFLYNAYLFCGGSTINVFLVWATMMISASNFFFTRCSWSIKDPFLTIIPLYIRMLSSDWLMKGVFFTNSSFFQVFHHCRDICLKISRYYRKISRSRWNPFFK